MAKSLNLSVCEDEPRIIKLVKSVEIIVRVTDKANLWS